MTINMIKDVLLWCVVLNYAILLIWAGVFVFARGWMYGIHSRWFKLSDEAFDAINYGGIAIYKIGIILFNLIPWIAMKLSS